MPGADIATLSKAQLFVHLAEGLAGGVTVLTPNQRLAQVLAREAAGPGNRRHPALRRLCRALL